MTTPMRGRSPRRPATVVLVLLTVLLAGPLVAVAPPAGAQDATTSATAVTSTTTTPSTSTSTTAAVPADEVTAPATGDVAPPATTASAPGSDDGRSEASYVGAPWFRPGVPYSQNFPDPTVVWDGSRYWAYATSTGGSQLPAMSSTDLVTWTPRPAYSPNPYNGDPYFNDAMPDAPQWTPGGTARLGKAQWAPGVARLGGGWTAYTSWEVGGGRRCISAARSASPQGPFVDPSPTPLVCDADPGGSIDPQPFVDTDGTPYLLWKSEGVPGSTPTRLWSRQLAADGMSFAPGSQTRLLLQTELPWEGNLVENPSMLLSDGTYWLLYSANEWRSGDYRMGHARCSGPLGPCVRASGTPLLGNTSTDLGPGGGTLFPVSGRVHVAYHAWNAPYTDYPGDPNCDGGGQCTSQGQRYLRIAALSPWAGRLTADPVGSIDTATGSLGSLTVAGWALDPSTASPIGVHVYVDGKGVPLTADGARPDLAGPFPGLGTAHGYQVTLAAAPGPHQVCVYGINVGPGATSLLGCRTVVVQSGSPFGALDVAAGGPRQVTVSGWAVDPDSEATVPVHVYVDGAGRQVMADRARPDVADALALDRAGHGFHTVVPAGPGAHSVCVYAINAGSGGNALLGCRTVVVPSGSPFGSLDEATGVPGGVTFAGWAIDPDTTAATEVHLYVGATGRPVVANRARPDVGSAFPAYGPAHGFSGTVAAPPGVHAACAYAINVGAGGTSLLGCRLVAVPDTSPFGSIDSIRRTGTSVTVSGWAIDPDTAQAIDVHVYVGSRGVAVTADRNRPDVGAAFPSAGPSHGFQASVPAGAGPQTACAYAINVAGGSNRLLGCHTIA